jgi:hypothetical protein
MMFYIALQLQDRSRLWASAAVIFRDFANSWVLQLLAPLVSLRKRVTTDLLGSGQKRWNSLLVAAGTGLCLSFAGI